MTAPSASRPLSARINSWPLWLYSVVVGALALITCALFYPPRIEVWARRNPNQQEWSRAESFLRQCDAPLSQNVEPAVRWRLLPPLVCHALGLRDKNTLACCWTGLAAFAVFLAARLTQLTGRRAWAALGTIGFATSGPFITALDWLGLNDGWYLLALLETVAAKTPWGLWAWAFVGPWIDERYLFGLPLALCVRVHLQDNEGKSRRTAWIAALAGIVPYLLFRSGFSLVHGDGASAGHVTAVLEVYRLYVSYVPLGLVMGYRAGLLALLFALMNKGIDPESRLNWILVGIIPLIALSMLAWDLDRSTGILLPLYVAGIAVAAKLSHRDQTGHSRYLALALGCLVLNLALPYAHVVGPTLSWNRGPLGIWRSLSGG